MAVFFLVAVVIFVGLNFHAKELEEKPTGALVADRCSRHRPRAYLRERWLTVAVADKVFC